MQKVICQHCGAEVGSLVTLANGQQWLRVGAVIVRNMHGLCQCGQPIHWTVSDKDLQKVAAWQGSHKSQDQRETQG